MSKCIYCGSIDLFIEHGAYKCTECGSHQINFVELVEDEEAWDLNRSRFYINPQKSKKNNFHKDIADIPLSWSYYEAYNKILKQWTDIIVKLGASKKYQETVFKLWVCYLQKRNIAFKQDLSDDTPRGGEGLFNRRDVVALKGAEIETRTKKSKEEKKKGSFDAVKDKIEKTKIKSNNPNRNLSYVVAGQMNETLKTINAFEEEDMEINELTDNEDMDETCYDNKSFMGEETMLSDVSEEDEEETDGEKDQSEKSGKLVVNMKRRKYIKFSDDFSVYFLAISPLYLNLPKLLTFLYLASMITEDEILLLDILRWCREDFIPYQSSAYILPKSMIKDIDDETVFNSHLPHASEVRFHTGAMAIYLSIQYLPLPSLEFLINKFADILKLPDDIRDIGLLTFRSVIFTSSSVTSLPPMETSAAAAIILMFKVTFGMDNYHEEKLSDFAETFNEEFKSNGSSYRVFSWRKWHKLIKDMRHLVGQVGVGINTYSRKDGDNNISVDAKRLSSYFWSKGLWKTPIGKDNISGKDQWDIHLLKSTLGLNLKDLGNVLEEKHNFRPYHIPYWGIVKQYLHESSLLDSGSNKEALIEIARKSDQASFSSHRFNWLLHSYEIIAEFRALGKDIDIVKIPICCPKKAMKIKSNSKENCVNFYIPDPLKSFWEAKDKSLNDCPSNFQWLVCVMSEICETVEEDVYKQYLKQEARYLSAINNTRLDNVKISFAEGENVSDLST